MTRSTIRLLLCLTVGGGAGGLVSAPAATRVTVAVSPARVNIGAKPGSANSTEITISNKGDEATGIRAAVEPYPGTGDE